MTKLSERGQFNGSILVADGEKVVYKKGFGYSDFDKKLPFASSTPCYIASLSKQFTGMAVKLHRLEENLGAVEVALSAEDLHELDRLTSQVKVLGARYGEGSQKLVNRQQ